MAEDPDIYRVNAFTLNPEEGNPAGVVPQASHLDAHQMQLIATSMGLSETAFVLPTLQPRCRFRLRWFTPTTEVRLCGHATVAALAVLTELGILTADGHCHLIETLSGNLRIRVDPGEYGRHHWLQIPPPHFREIIVAPEELRRLFAIEPQDLDGRLPAVRDEDGPYIPVRSLEILRRLRPDFARMRASDTWKGACFFTEETVEPQNTWHCRFFAPGFGIDEDPVTGAINGPLGGYHRLYLRSQQESQQVEYVGEQGDFIGHRGRVRVRVRGLGDEIHHLEIGGQAVIVDHMPVSAILTRRG